MRKNPRNANGTARRKLAARMRAEGAPCALCFKPIDYSAPYLDPFSFVIDEDKPVSRWREFGYPSAQAAALDPDNVQPAHRCCNSAKGAMTTSEYHAHLRGRGPRAEVADGW